MKKIIRGTLSILTLSATFTTLNVHANPTITEETTLGAEYTACDSGPKFCKTYIPTFIPTAGSTVLSAGFTKAIDSVKKSLSSDERKVMAAAQLEAEEVLKTENLEVTSNFQIAKEIVAKKLIAVEAESRGVPAESLQGKVFLTNQQAAQIIASLD